MSLDFSCHFNSVIYFFTFRGRFCVSECARTHTHAYRHLAYQVVLVKIRGQSSYPVSSGD